MHSVSFPIAHDHPAYAGHFPGQPLLPGVLLIAHVLEAALAEPAYAASLGPAPQLASAKFLAPVRPGESIEVRLDMRPGAPQAPARIAFEVHCGERIAASGQFEGVAPGAAA